ncbi:TPA: phage antirepressor KilAC domain-containing protein [Burkholderia vietnamiensis]|uniref:phage antirepressor KilAC domain-containing protein n=1 Tax=Burkholderia vietnamiensis TaxID=60552 RepID=UPI001B954A05|nr:phage antirepressor KilAC domain-containing protein [Burkholderia vietnamiensis]MBR7910022.1 phage antirepressor KilAC domain-containing protein [Burkholderia vietnamiensis]HDR9274238.1 phage antirepressor KilAC domain-containing protein [Burkholderia vietnamiensis]
MGAILQAAVLTMSSREIADLVESRHDSVKRTVERLADRGVIDLPPLVEYLDGLGRKAAEYQIGKRDSYVIVAQLSPEFTARLVDRWQELEQYAVTASPAVPQTFADALRLAADQQEQIDAQRRQIEQQKPAVEFAHAVRNTTDAISIGDMARVLGIGQNRLFRQLRADHLLMADNRPYQHYIDRGYFRMVESVWIDAEKESHPTFKTLVTGRGQVYLQRRYGQQPEQAA